MSGQVVWIWSLQSGEKGAVSWTRIMFVLGDSQATKMGLLCLINWGIFRFFRKETSEDERNCGGPSREGRC